MNICDSRFKYVNAAATDIRKLFDRVQPGWNKRHPGRALRRETLPDNVRKLQTTQKRVRQARDLEPVDG